MHTAGKVLLIIGGVLTAIGIGITVMGAASASLDPSSENVAEGTSFTFTIPDDDIYGVYTKASVNCDAIGDTITISIVDSDGDEQFSKDCQYNEDDDYLDDDYQRVGDINWFLGVDAGDVVTINSDVKIYIVGDIEAFGDAVVNTLAQYAPNIKDIILHRQVLSPMDLENTFGLTEGNIFHGELTIQQLFSLRPAAKWANYTSPIKNYFQCGSGTHPGGGITGSPGEMAAKKILGIL